MNNGKIISQLFKQADFDVHSPIPLYHQVYSLLNKLITDKIVEPGSPFPPEIELSQELNVSRQTVRQAMAQLVREGKVERFSGKGTFVTDQNTRNQFFLDKSFSQQMADMGMKTYARVLELSEGIVDESCSNYLQEKLGTACLRLTRLRFGDDKPISLQYALVLTEKCPGIANYDFTNRSLFHLITDVYQLEIAEILHTVNAILADDHQARLLEIKPGDPLLVEEAVTFLSDGSPIETTTSYFRADRYAYSVRFQYKQKKSIWQGV